MRKTNSKRVTISKTKREWDAIQNKLKSIGRSDLNAYIRGQLSLLEKQYEECPSCICNSVTKRTQKAYTVQPSPMKMLIKVGLKTNTPVATVLDRLIIDPLILPK